MHACNNNMEEVMNPRESWGKGGAGWGEEGMEMIQM